MQNYFLPEMAQGCVGLPVLSYQEACLNKTERKMIKPKSGKINLQNSFLRIEL
jgi:hypothetical protein